jgi:diguanylate cyclase (GGDEF)-like protein/PAS domain S-box-containing protein
VIRGASLLVVDDSEPNRDALSRRLRQRGYTVDTAADGRGALAVLATGTHDLVLLDVEMPGMSGLEVLRTLRQTRSQTDLPIIMVTARTQGADIVEAFGLGANDYVTKPIDFPVLLARLGTHLAHQCAVRALRESEERFAVAVRGANDGLWDWNLVTNEVYWSPRWKAMVGQESGDIGVSLDEWLSRVHDADAARVRKDLEDHLGSGGGHYESEHRLQHRSGAYRWVRCRAAAVRTDDGVATRLAGSFTDITDAKVADALTGLPNRLLFVDLVERAVTRTGRRRDYAFALLLLGLHRFKAVNATLGMVTADHLLAAVARRLQAVLRSGDASTGIEQGATLARLGGDEFAVLLEDVGEPRHAVRIAERLCAELEKPFEVDGQQVFTSAAVGIAMSGTGYTSAGDILRDAAIALQRANAAGPSSCELFDLGMRQKAISRLEAEIDLRRAIETRALCLYYQPVVCLRTGEILTFEALVRWKHPLRGVVGAAEFIPIAEDTGLVLEIGRMTLIESIRQMAEWKRRFGPGAPQTVSVNVSSLQFADGSLLDDLKRVLASEGLDGSAVKLEITESAFIADVEAAQETLRAARAFGVRWSLDDFGTGYSSMSYLHKLQVDTVKIDRAFVSGMGPAGSGLEMVRAIVAMAHNLRMDVVAEGVEGPDELAHLRALGCDSAQGFYFSRPVPADAAERLIADRPWASGPRGASVQAADPAPEGFSPPEAGRHVLRGIV